MFLNDCIIYQNVDSNIFIASLPGSLVVGYVKKVKNEDLFEFEKYGTITQSNLECMSRCLENIAKSLAKKKGAETPEKYILNSGNSTLLRKESSLFFLESDNSENVRCAFDLSAPKVFRKFCQGLFAVGFSLLLPTDQQLAVFCELNTYCRNTFTGLSINRDLVDNSPILLKASPSLRHYIRQNFEIVAFSYKMSMLARIQ